MITLHGFPYSNYYNIVKHVLLHKGIPFEEDINYGGTDDYLAVSPVGKIPSLTTEQGDHLSESSVCCDYLDETYSENPLYPGNGYERAQVRQIMKISELYLELPCRRLLAFVFTNKEPPTQLKEEIRQTVERGAAAMRSLCQFEPYIVGKEFSMADIYVRYVLDVVNMGSATLKWDIVATMPGMSEWSAMLEEAEISQQIDADKRANQADFFAAIMPRLGS